MKSNDCIILKKGINTGERSMNLSFIQNLHSTLHVF